MKLELYRVWARQEEKMYFKPEIIGSNGLSGNTYIKCYDKEGNEKQLAYIDSIVDVMYDTTMIDDKRKPIISGDMLEVEIRNEGIYKVYIMTHKDKSHVFFDFHPRIITPSLGIGYLLSANVVSVNVIGNIYER